MLWLAAYSWNCGQKRGLGQIGGKISARTVDCDVVDCDGTCQSRVASIGTAHFILRPDFMWLTRLTQQQIRGARIDQVIEKLHLATA